MATQGVTYKTDKLMPTWEQLAEMGRELRFYPSVTEHPKVLTQEQLANFNRLDYIKGVVVSGKDSSGHWGNPPRPSVD